MAEISNSISWNGVWLAIPAYNEASTIRALVEQALTQCTRVIVVDDGSTDGTADQLLGLPVTVLRHPANAGKAASLITAFSFALDKNANCVISMDGDGQHDPVDARRLLGIWLRQPDRIVIGARLHDHKQFPALRYYANRIACFWISWAAGYAIADSQSGFRIYPNSVMRIALSGKVTGERFTFESEILIEAAQQGIFSTAVAIAGIYPPNLRPSHFRPMADIAKIVAMVAARLLRQGLAPMGLARSLKRASISPVLEEANTIQLAVKRNDFGGT